MPITPQFQLSQTLTHVELSIRVPHVRVTTESIQVVVDDDQTVHFSSSPYLLRLQFAPHQFHATAAEACATYQPTIENGTIVLLLKKETPGNWENLDLLGKWAQPAKTRAGAKWLQQVIPDGDESAIQRNENDEQMVDSMSSRNGYGFL